MTVSSGCLLGTCLFTCTQLHTLSAHDRRDRGMDHGGAAADGGRQRGGQAHCRVEQDSGSALYVRGHEHDGDRGGEGEEG
eukprot:9714-Eustigmatos_ZCMA.PRE.1